jgi:hypothetical protein
MKTEAHMQLAANWDRTLSKLDPKTDHLAVLEFCMMMGTTLMNAVLHKRGIREEAFDQNHTNRPPLPEEAEAMITPDVRAMMDDMHYIEAARNLHCRAIGEDRSAPRILPDWDPAVAEKCLVNLRKMQAFTEKVMAE